MDVTAPGKPAAQDDPLFAVDAEYTGGCVRLALRGELDVATVAVLDDELRRAWSHDIRRVEIDLRDLTFMGSAGVAAILEANARASAVGCALTLVRGGERVHRIFELTGIEDQFAFRPDAARPARDGPVGVVG